MCTNCPENVCANLIVVHLGGWFVGECSLHEDMLLGKDLIRLSKKHPACDAIFSRSANTLPKAERCQETSHHMTSLSTCRWGELLNSQLEFFCLLLSFSPCSPLSCLLESSCFFRLQACRLSDCRLKVSTISPKAPTVSKKAPEHNRKQKSSTAGLQAGSFQL